MNRTKTLIAALIVAILGGYQSAEAGCGCDHPPPVKGYVYPSFAWPGSSVSVYSEALQAGERACINSALFNFDTVTVSSDGSSTTDLPWFAWTGPIDLNIFSKPCKELKWGDMPDDRISGEHLTVLPEVLPVVEASGTFYYENVEVAVDTQGRILLPFDLSNLREPMQFFVMVDGLPLRFAEDDVDYFNKDEVNLKLFEMLVASPEEHQWGAFYGALVDEAADAKTCSDVISYWRHEFDTYADAHRAGGSHEVGKDGLHPDGSRHIDHYNLVAAVRPLVCESADSDDCERLKGGSQRLTLKVYQLISPKPIAMGDLSDEYIAKLEANSYSITVDYSGEATITPLESSLEPAPVARTFSFDEWVVAADSSPAPELDAVVMTSVEPTPVPTVQAAVEPTAESTSSTKKKKKKK